MPSGILIVTSVSTTSISAADAELVAATTPAATDMAMKSRREQIADRFVLFFGIVYLVSH